MKIRNKILLYFSPTVILLTTLSSVIIYFLFAAYREEEFQQRQKEKIAYTVGMMTHYKEISENLTAIMDELTIHDFYDEKMMIFDHHKNLVYKSVDDLLIDNYQQILNDLSPARQWIETKQGSYDIVGVYIENDQTHFYAISKAYDAAGYDKLHFLRNTLFAISIIISLVLLLVSYYLSAKISEPITTLAKQLNSSDLISGDVQAVRVNTSSFEINDLTEKFNQLIRRVNEVFAFQKHSIHHISHQLKTPIAILVSELERIQQADVPPAVKEQLQEQVSQAKSLGDIIDSLLEISKIESGQPLAREAMRIDELLFDLFEAINTIYPSFVFEQNYSPECVDESKLTVRGNRLMLKQAFQNILTNCVQYSDNGTAQVYIDCSAPGWLKLQFVNTGTAVDEKEARFLFEYFFRGTNSAGKSGFGLGLVLTSKILSLHAGTIVYAPSSNNVNVFDVALPLS